MIDGNNGEVGGSDVMCTSATSRSDKRQAWLPTDHFRKLLEEACPNQVYPVKHKLKNYSDEKLHDLRIPHLGCGAR
jgi:hypothetical protein